MINDYQIDDLIEYRDIHAYTPGWIPGTIIGITQFEPDNYTFIEIELYNGKTRNLCEPEIKLYLRHKDSFWDKERRVWVRRNAG